MKRNKRHSRNAALTALVLISVAGMAMAAPLWLGGNDLYTPGGTREFKPGDIITVNVAEQASAQQKASSATADDSSVEVKATPQIPAIPKLLQKFTGKHEVKNTWNGNGTTSRSGNVSATVSAQVLEVLPNGNLLIEGHRRVRVNKEAQIIHVRGVARPRDIDAKNNINSTALADAEIKYEGKGAVGATQRPGLFTKVTSFLF